MSSTNQQSLPSELPDEFAPITDDPSLPRILLVGDSISVGYTLPVRILLRNKANVHRPSVNCSGTTLGLQCIDEWLGTDPWQVIHFNWGLHDLKHIDKHGAMSSPDVGKPQASLTQYEKNMRVLVERLQRANAQLIWCSTTPVPAGAKARISGSEVDYNAAAARVMAENNIPVHDLHAFVAPRMQELQNPADVHFTPAGSAALAEQVARAIEPYLAIGN